MDESPKIDKELEVKILEPKLDLAVTAGNYMSESPVWSVESQTLYWINCEDSPEIHCWRPKSGERRIWPMPERVGGVVLKQGGNTALVVLADGVYEFDLRSGALELIVRSPMKHAALHECACDRSGRLWVGAIDHRIDKPDMLPGGGSLFRLDGNRLVPVLEGVSCSNGLAFSPDGKTLYHTDAPTGVIEAYSLDSSGSLSNRRQFVRLQPGEGFCDGATVDAEGGYWAALVFGGALRRYLPDGTLDLEVRLPFDNPTKVAFGGEDLQTLYITTTRMVLGAQPPKGQEMLGEIYSFRPGVKGLPEPQFLG